MRHRSDTWIKLAARGRFRMESVAVIGGVEYTAISAPAINRGLLSDNLSVGNCISATLKMSVLTDDEIGKSASVVIKARITDDVEYSEWLEFGTFYIDNRTVNSGLVTLLCYDSMLKASQQYVDETLEDDRIGWPKSMDACVKEIAARIGVEIDSRTVIKTGDAYQVPYPTKLTMMEVLGYIGACHGGNWIITPENKLRLVPLLSPPVETFNIIDHDYNPIYTGDGHKLVWQHSQTGETVEHKAGGGLINVPVVIGKIETSKARTVSRVTLARDEELGYTLGDDTGYEIRIESNPYACQAICDDLYAELNGLEYAPFAIQSACYDPATELGDWILVGDQVRSVLYTENATLNVDFRVNATAPGKDEVSSEYPYLTTIQRLKQKDEQLEKYMEESKTEINSKIEQTYTEILLSVSGTYATKGALESVSAALELTAEEVTAEVKRATGAELELSGRITVNADSITSEVSRAKGEESKLSSSIAQTAEKVELKVSKGDISSQISVESGTVTIGSNRLVIESTNFKLNGSGSVTANGTLSAVSGDYKTSVAGGELKFYVSDTQVGSIRGSTTMRANDNSGNYDINSTNINTLTDALTFSFGSNRRLLYQLTPDSNFDGSIGTHKFEGHLWSEIMHTYALSFDASVFDAGYLWANGDVLEYEGTQFTVIGDFSVSGSKNRIVETENYGSVLMNAVESPAALFIDVGTVSLDDTGIAYVFIEPKFMETLDSISAYQVLITNTSSGKISHVEKHSTHFVVYGDPLSTADWMITARQKDYGNVYMEPYSRYDTDDIRYNFPVESDSIAESVSEAYMAEFEDTYDQQAEAYLNQYEQEVTNYGN